MVWPTTSCDPTGSLISANPGCNDTKCHPRPMIKHYSRLSQLFNVHRLFPPFRTLLNCTQVVYSLDIQPTFILHLFDPNGKGKSRMIIIVIIGLSIFIFAQIDTQVKIWNQSGVSGEKSWNKTYFFISFTLSRPTIIHGQYTADDLPAIYVQPFYSLLDVLDSPREVGGPPAVNPKSLILILLDKKSSGLLTIPPTC